VSDIETVTTQFQQRLGRAPAGVWAAPGRLNLIGEHTDYNDGFVMPYALPQRVAIAAGARNERRWSVTSLNSDSTETFGPDDLNPGMQGWQAYVAGVVWALQQGGHDVGGADLVLTSNVPLGAGLSSSAALECATLTALAELFGLEIALLDQAKLARRCENEFVGAPTGLMDQAASIMCTRDHALFLDCRSFETEQVPLELRHAGLEILVLDTRTPHALVSSEYATRRTTCEQAAGILGVPALRDVDDLAAALRRLPDEEMRQRVRHVVTENGRVLEAVDVLRSGRFRDLGPLLDASHLSMRDDFQITVPTVDLAVESAREAGALGARMTGGGFGGCIIALVEAGASEEVADHIHDRFTAAGYGPPAHFVALPSPGAGRVA
jgi:galactokinase